MFQKQDDWIAVISKIIMKRNFKNYEGDCNGFSRETGDRCGRPITASAVIGTDRCCLIKNKDFGCPNHGSGELVIKSKWIGVRNCDGCVNENCPPFTYGREKNINQIVWELV